MTAAIQWARLFALLPAPRPVRGLLAAECPRPYDEPTPDELIDALNDLDAAAEREDERDDEGPCGIEGDAWAQMRTYGGR